MHVIAFGGWGYAIDKWLPARAIHYPAPLWGFTRNWCREFALGLRRPVILIGFSEGANAAMYVAGHSCMVHRAIVHSCQAKKFPFNSNCDYRLFCTVGDTTPTFRGTIQVHETATVTTQLQILPYVPFENPTMFERKRLAPRRHVFHNLVPHLSSLGV